MFINLNHRELNFIISSLGTVDNISFGDSKEARNLINKLVKEKETLEEGRLLSNSELRNMGM